jgi:hypothetical protein
MPQWFPAVTGPAPARAPLAIFDPGSEQRGDTAGRIALITFKLEALHQRAGLLAAAHAAGARAVVAITEGPSGGIFAPGALARGATCPLPVVLVSRDDAPALRAVAEHGEEAILLLDGVEEPAAAARNVVGHTGHGSRLAVISTAQSGWFRCAGERGTGVAIFLALARWAAEADRDTRFLFVSTSGHELDGAGMRAFMAAAAPPPAGVDVWLHLGASIATRAWWRGSDGLPVPIDRAEAQPMRCSPELLGLISPLYTHLQHVDAGDTPPRGEMEFILGHGYRAFGYFGRHHVSHTPADGPEATAPELLESMARVTIAALNAVLH